jgi:hypothetical protein
MKSAKDRVRLDKPCPLNRTKSWRILTQRPMCSDVIIIVSIGPKDPAQMGLWTRNQRSLFVNRIRPRTLRRNTINWWRSTTFSTSSRLLDKWRGQERKQ